MLVVHSPHSGRPVKVREQDVGRAVRDETGRIFYVLTKADGSGYYGSKTRSGAANKEPRVKTPPALGPEHRPDAPIPQPHNAAGRKRSTHRGKLVVLVLFIILAVLFYLFSPYGPYYWKKFNRTVRAPSNKIFIGSSPRADPGTVPGDGRPRPPDP